MRLKILNVILKNKSAGIVTIGNTFTAPDNFIDPTDLDAILKNLRNEGYLESPHNDSNSYSLTSKGREYRLELEQASKQAAEDAAKQAQAEAQSAANEKKKLRNDLKVAVISSFLSVLTTLTLEHFDILVELIKKFFVIL